MNAERLYAVASALKTELETTGTARLVRRIGDLLAALAQQPGDVNSQQQLTTTLTDLSTAGTNAESENFSPAWRETLKRTLNLEHLLGNALASSVEAVVRGNAVTPASAQEAVLAIADELDVLVVALDGVVSGFDQLGIESEELAPGEFEVGILIPRGAVHNEFGALGTEFTRLERVLQPFAELATGSRPPFELRSISSSEFGAVVNSTPLVAACIAHGVAKTASFYKDLLEIRKLHEDAKAKGVSDARVAGLAEHAKELMTVGIAEAVVELVERFSVVEDEHRLNELRIDLTLALNSIANRIDDGYNFEVRAAPLPAAGDSEDGVGTSARKRRRGSSRSRGSRFYQRYGFKNSGTPRGAVDSRGANAARRAVA